MSGTNHRRVLFVVLPTVLLLWGGGLALLSFMGGEGRQADGAGSGGAVVDQPSRFRGGRLPDGIRGAPAPPFRLADARGGKIDTRRLRGRPYVITFLYTDCPDTCPLIAAELRKALEILAGRASKVAVLAVSADPESDTPAAVRRWLRRHRLPANFHYLVGSDRELEPVWDDYYVAPQRHGDPNSTHSASIWLIDAEGRLRTKFSAGFPVPPADIAHDLGILVREAQRAA